MAALGVELPDWTPPPWPGPLRLDGRYARLEPLAPGHAAALHAANEVDDAIWDYMPYGPFATEAAYADWVCRMAGKADPQPALIVERAGRVEGAADDGGERFARLRRRQLFGQRVP